jgi:hypothetical protein
MSDSPLCRTESRCFAPAIVLLVPIATIRSGETLSSDKAGVS